MKKDLVTVVVPIYNVEKYLERCLESIVNQTYKELEVLLIDDGSTDSCPSICEQWQKKDNRIKVIHKQNAGLGMARNTGIENATGAYICFFDSDDYIAPETISTCLHTIRQENADIVHFGLCIVDQNQNIKKKITARKKEVYRGTKVREDFMTRLITPYLTEEKSLGIWMSICGVFFSMQLIQGANWRCASEREIIAEDLYSLLCLYNYVECVVILPDIFYYYCENLSSLTHVYRQDRFEKIKCFYKKCLIACDKYKYSNDIRYGISHPFLDYTIAALKQITVTKDTLRIKLKLIKEIIVDEEFQEAIKKNINLQLSISKRILYYIMQRKWLLLCFLLLRAKA